MSPLRTRKMAITMKYACMLCLVLALSSKAVSAQSPYQSVLSGLTSTIGTYFAPGATQTTQSSLSSLLNAYLVTSDPKSTDPQFCASATLIPASANPAVIIAPSMTITLNTGSCQLMKNANDIHEAIVTCLAPSIKWVKAPLTYVAPFESAAVFTTKECVAGKNLTVGSSQILYSGGAPVTYPTIAAWLASYKTGAYNYAAVPPAPVAAAAVVAVPVAVVLPVVPAPPMLPVPFPAAAAAAASAVAPAAASAYAAATASG